MRGDRAKYGERVVQPASLGLPGSGLSEDPSLTIVAEPAARELKGLLAAWRSWPKDGRLPRRALFDPVDFPRLLPWMLLYEFDQHPNRYRDYDMLFRYIGSALADTLQSRGLTGSYISDLPDPFPERWFPTFDRLRETAAPMAVRGKPYLVDKTYLKFEMLYLPLARNEPADADEVGFNLLCMHQEPVR